MRKNGFTIPELLIVMVIMGLLLGIGIPNFKAQRDQLDFNQSVSRILEIIKAARNYALTSRPAIITNPNGTVATNPDGSIKKGTPREGYGVYFKKTLGTPLTLTLFANMEVDPVTGDEKNEEIYDTGDTIEETYTLPTLALLESLKGDTLDTTELLILFKPPLGEASMNNNLATSIANSQKYNNFSLQIKSPTETQVLITMNAVSGFPEVKYLPKVTPLP